MWSPLAWTLAFRVVSADPFGSCEQRVLEQPEARDGYACFLTAARSGELLDRAAERLDELHAEGMGSPYATLTLGGVELNRGRSRAGPLLESAARALAEVDPEAAVLAWLNRSLVARYAGRTREAGAALDAAEQIARASGSSRLWLIMLERARVDLVAEADAVQVEKRLHAAQLALPPDAPSRDRARLLELQADVANQRGRLGEAREIRERAANLMAEAGQTYAEADVRHNLWADLLWSHVYAGWLGPGPVDEGRALVDLAEGSGNRAVEAAARCELAMLLPTEAAFEEIARCRQLAEAADDDYARFFARQAEIGRRAAEGGRYLEPVAALLEKHHQHARGAEGFTFQFLAHGVEATYRHAVGDVQGAIRAGRRGVEVLDAWSRRRTRLEERASRLSDYAWVHHQLIGHLLSTGEPLAVDQAFAVAERMRAAEVSERIRLVDELNLAANHPLARRRRALDDAANRVQRAILQTADPAARKVALAELGSLETKIEHLQASLQHELDSAAMLPVQVPVSLSEIRAALRPDEAFVWFQEGADRWWNDVGGGGSWIVVVTREQVRVRSIPSAARLQSASRTWVGLMRQRDSVDQAAATAMGRQVFADTLDALPDEVQQLVILPEGSLFELPFAALVVDGEHRLIERFDVSVILSGTKWLRDREQDSSAPAGVLALADPAFDSASAGERAPWRGLSEELIEVPGRLPLARLEVEMLQQTLAGTTVWVDRAASEVALLGANLEDVGVLHLASHAWVDPVHPHRSALLLAPGSSDYDGLLQWREISRLRLGGLVVLSACRSGGAKLPGSEGPSSLAAAFVHAGARTVVANTWPLRDDDAQALFAHFYRHLGRGASVAQALAAAQRDRIAEGAPPEAWAGAVVFGDGSLIVSPAPDTSVGPWWLWVILAGFTAVAARVACRRS